MAAEYRSTVKKYKLDGAIVDDALIDPMNLTLISGVKSFLDQAGGATNPFFLLSVERDAAALSKIMEGGFTDIFTKPVDASMFFQKLRVYFSKIKFLKESLLFNLKVNSTLELALACKLLNASEFGMTVRLNRELHAGELFPIYGKMFGLHSGNCLARVLSCAATNSKVGDEKYEAVLLFIAPRRDFLTNMRLWLRQEYVRAREPG